MLLRPSDIRPYVDNLIVKLVLKSEHQPLLAFCLAIAILQNGKAGVVGKVGAAGRGTMVL